MEVFEPNFFKKLKYSREFKSRATKIEENKDLETVDWLNIFRYAEEVGTFAQKSAVGVKSVDLRRSENMLGTMN
jgi:hypothetical protein